MKIGVNLKQQRANTFPWLYWVLRPQWDWHVCLTPTSLWQNLQPLFFFLFSCTSISCRAITITNDRTDGSGRSKKGGKVANRSQIGLEQLKTPSNFSDRKCKFQRYKYLTLESWLLAREGVPSKGKGCSKVQLSISLPWQERNARRSCLQRRSIQQKYFYEKPHLDNLSSPVNRCSGDKTVCCTLLVRHRWLQLCLKGCRVAYLGLVITTFLHLSMYT